MRLAGLRQAGKEAEARHRRRNGSAGKQCGGGQRSGREIAVDDLLCTEEDDEYRGKLAQQHGIFANERGPCIKACTCRHERFVCPVEEASKCGFTTHALEIGDAGSDVPDEILSTPLLLFDCFGSTLGGTLVDECRDESNNKQRQWNPCQPAGDIGDQTDVDKDKGNFIQGHRGLSGGEIADLRNGADSIVDPGIAAPLELADVGFQQTLEERDCHARLIAGAQVDEDAAAAIAQECIEQDCDRHATDQESRSPE